MGAKTFPYKVKQYIKNEYIYIYIYIYTCWIIYVCVLCVTQVAYIYRCYS